MYDVSMHKLNQVLIGFKVMALILANCSKVLVLLIMI